MDKVYGVSIEKLNTDNSKNSKFSEEPYTVLMLINDLKKYLHSITNSIISDKKLSKFLSQNEKLITYIKKNNNRNPRFQISLQELSEYKFNLRTRLKEKSLSAINLIELYKRLNNLKKSPHKIYNFHPNFKLYYFKNINTKEKAYWLGFIFADGSIGYKRGGRGNKSINLRFRFGLDAKDIDSVNAVDCLAKTLGIEPKYINIKSNGLYGFEITSDILVNHLIEHSLLIGKKKTYNIELPMLSSRELLLAFLLGFFDGDGKRGSTRITSSSFKFLDQIKIKFNLPYTIYHEPGKNAWSLHLGAELFNQMLDNYKKSMPRKRVRLVTPKELKERNTKIMITTEVLEEIQNLVLRIPIKELCVYYGISSSRLGQICRENDIIIPPRGYWVKNKKIGISPLYMEGI